MTTCADMINETKRYLLAGHREMMNAVNGGINNTVTTIPFVYNLASIAPGSVISVDLEVMYVWTADQSTKTVTVQRGYLGSVAATHAAGSMVTVNPKFSDFAIMQALNSDIDDLSGDLYQVRTTSLTYIPGKIGYDLTGASSYDVIGILEMRYDLPGVTRSWPSMFNSAIRRDSDLTDFPSGYAVEVRSVAFPGRQVRITYSAAFKHLSALTDDVSTVSGLPTGTHDIPPLGAAVRLQGVREGQRNFNDNQPDTRRAAEVPAGANAAAIRPMMDFHQTRVRSTMKDQLQRYPYHVRLKDSGVSV